MKRTVGFTMLALIGGLVACQPGPRDLSLRFRSEDMEFQILPDPVPPRARELGGNRYRVIVRDRETKEPIEGGLGQIFATSRDGLDSYAPLEKGEELGTYYATLHFVTAGEWAMGLFFQRDSSSRRERLDWMQEVFAARGETPAGGKTR